MLDKVHTGQNLLNLIAVGLSLVSICSVSWTLLELQAGSYSIRAKLDKDMKEFMQISDAGWKLLMQEPLQHLRMKKQAPYVNVKVPGENFGSQRGSAYGGNRRQQGFQYNGQQGNKQIPPTEGFFLGYGRPVQYHCACSSQNSCPPGPMGSTGDPGADGCAGDAGKNGVKGELGQLYRPPLQATNKCRQCPMGPKGPVGQRGSPGRPGRKGPRGPLGKPGRLGPFGRRGPQGYPGYHGRPGNAGPMGPPGSIGVYYTKGDPGPRGEKGLPGPAGQVDRIGYPGNPGRGGQKGYRGPQGKSGPIGPKGRPGKPGAPGRPGIDARYCTCPNRQQTPGQQYANRGGSPQQPQLVAPLVPVYRTGSPQPLSPPIYVQPPPIPIAQTPPQQSAVTAALYPVALAYPTAPAYPGPPAYATVPFFVGGKKKKMKAA